MNGPIATAEELQLQTLAGCVLVIGGYPRFRYNGTGGGGPGALAAPGPGGLRRLRFEPDTLQIPPLNWRSTRFLGLPLPPGLSIAICPQVLEGELQPASGEVRLRLRARFEFSIAGLYRAPALAIDCELSSSGVQGRRQRLGGASLTATGEMLLAGAAWVEPCGESWLDRFLGLPDEALAQLRCRLGPPQAADAAQQA